MASPRNGGGGTAASTNGSDERASARGRGPPPFLFLFRPVRSILVLPSPFRLVITRSARSTPTTTPGRHSPRSRVGPSVKVSSEDLEPDAKGRRRAGSVHASTRLIDVGNRLEPPRKRPRFSRGAGMDGACGLQPPRTRTATSDGRDRTTPSYEPSV